MFTNNSKLSKVVDHKKVDLSQTGVLVFNMSNDKLYYTLELADIVLPVKYIVHNIEPHLFVTISILRDN